VTAISPGIVFYLTRLISFYPGVIIARYQMFCFAWFRGKVKAMALPCAKWFVMKVAPPIFLGFGGGSGKLKLVRHLKL
jgi:hypothetical protein